MKALSFCEASLISRSALANVTGWGHVSTTLYVAVSAKVTPALPFSTSSFRARFQPLTPDPLGNQIVHFWYLTFLCSRVTTVDVMPPRKTGSPSVPESSGPNVGPKWLRPQGLSLRKRRSAAEPCVAAHGWKMQDMVPLADSAAPPRDVNVSHCPDQETFFAPQMSWT